MLKDIVEFVFCQSVGCIEKFNTAFSIGSSHSILVLIDMPVPSIT